MNVLFNNHQVLRAYTGRTKERFFLPAYVIVLLRPLQIKTLFMFFQKLLKAGAAASLVMSCANINAQSWSSNSTYGLYTNTLTGTKGNVAIGVAASSSYQANRLTIKADASKNGLRIYDSNGNTKLLQGSNGGLTVGAASTAPSNGLYVSGNSTLNGAVTANNGLNVNAGLAKFNGPVSMNSTLITTGATTFNSTMTVVGKTTLAGGLSVTGATTTSALTASSLTSTGATNLKSTLAVTGKATLSGALSVAGATTLKTTTTGALTASSLTVSGATTLNGSFIAKGTSNTFYNGLQVNTGTGIYNSIRLKADNGWALISAYGYSNYDPMAFLGSKYNFRNGNVGIGVENPTAKLHVAGKILCTGEIEVADLNSNSIKVNSLNAKDIQMEMHGAADYVFEDNYNLKSLSEVESYVNEHKHLPGMPSAAEMDANGVSVSKMSNLLLEKVEELTLHMIQLEKENAALKARVESLSK